MRIASIEAFKLSIPFKSAFKHSSATRAETSSIWVKVISDCGVVGYGESCPRSYVTQETLQSSLDFINQISGEIIAEIHDINQLKEWVRQESDQIDKNPAAWCALELALLDVLAHVDHCSVESLLGLADVRDEFTYSAILGDSSMETFERQLQQYLHLEMNDLKLKISGERGVDQKKMELLTESKGMIENVRLDANNLWHDAETVIDYISQLNYPIWAIEEPVAAYNYAMMLAIAQQTQVKIILDESVLNVKNLHAIADEAEHWVINLRISKMGGIIRSLDLAQTAKGYGMPLIIGAQVGETSLLSRAALTIAQTHRPLAQEGAFGTNLLSDDVVDNPIMFGGRGILNVDTYAFSEKCGFGLRYKDIDKFLTRPNINRTFLY